jgi:NAD(P)-dependent dehydrogenase (short-subunit alcohol dehydrogenase family)
MGALDGKVALVTGGGAGIGRAVVERYVQEGARVGVIERRAERVEELNGTFNGAVMGIQGDVSSTEDNRRAVEETVRRFGQLDIFVGNAGIFDRFVKLADVPLEKLSQAFDELYNVNVKGYFLGARAAIDELTKTEGCMVFTVSVAGFFAGGGGTLYTSSKHALVGFVRQLASELNPTIRVNGVAPGGVLTDLRGLAALEQDAPPPPRLPEAVARMQQPSDLAGCYVFLASKTDAKHITGPVLDTTSGAWARSITGR